LSGQVNEKGALSPRKGKEMAQIGEPLREGEILVPREFPPPKEAPDRVPTREPAREPSEPAPSRRRRKKVPS
jgi:hypothetical protein